MKTKKNCIIKLCNGDIFSTNNKTLVHCVSADLEIKNDIDRQFRNRYGRKKELKLQNLCIGKCCVVKTNKQTIFYLISSNKNFEVTTYKVLENCLKNLLDKCIEMKLENFAISQRSFEFDNLDWNIIKELINKIFYEYKIELCIYENQNPNEFKLIQTILKYCEPQMTTCFNPEVDIIDKRTNNIVTTNNISDTVRVNFKHYQLMNSRCIIETQINDFQVDALVDTGVDFCYIREELCDELNLEVEKYECDVLVGNNQKLDVTGKVSLYITIENHNYLIQCTVVKTLSNSLILGWIGFIKENNGIINAQEGTFSLKRPIKHPSSFAFLQESILMKPFTENVITAQIHETANSKMNLVNKYEPLFTKAGISILPGKHEGKNDNNFSNQRNINLILTNLSSKPVELPKFTVVATLSTVCDPQEYTRAESAPNLKSISDTPQNTPTNTVKDSQVKTNTNLTEIQKLKVNDLLEKYNNLFEIKSKRKLASNIYHEIDTGNEKPINNPPNRIAFKEREYIQQQIEEMEKSNIIQPSSSPWSSRIVLVKKKDGKLRFCIDYRGLNAITKKDVYPLPRIDDSLAMLSKGIFFTTLDLWSGYWQIPLESKSKEKTAFSTDSGLYEFNVMPFGLCNAPATFQRFMDATLAGLKWKNLVVYMDDIIVFSSTFEEHIDDLNEVFKRLSKANVTLNQNKCEFFKDKIHYLGHVISSAGIQPSPEKIKSLLLKKSPSNVKELGNWLGISGFYRTFIENYARKCAPLYAITHKKTKFIWTEKEEKIITELKQRLSSEPILSHPNFDYPFILRTDASIDGLGGTLSQIVDSKERVIQYISRSVQPNEKNWNVQQLEALAIIWACETLRAYIIINH